MNFGKDFSLLLSGQNRTPQLILCLSFVMVDASHEVIIFPLPIYFFLLSLVLAEELFRMVDDSIR